MLSLPSWSLLSITQVVCIVLRQEIHSFSQNKYTQNLRTLASFHSINIKDLVLPSPINNPLYVDVKYAVYVVRLGYVIRAQ